MPRTPKARGMALAVNRRSLTGVGAALALATLMAVSTSVPAQSLVTSAEVQAAHQPDVPAEAGPAQTLRIPASTVAIAVQRDGYAATSVADAAAARVAIAAAAEAAAHPVRWPLPAGTRIGDHFGYRNCAGCSTNHMGQDFNPGFGAPIYAIANGTVSYVEDGDRSLGVHVIIDHVIDGQTVSSVYSHMIHGSATVRAGDRVLGGQIVGQVGTTGMSTGPHLHFEIRLGGRDGARTDPLAWLTAHAR